MNNATLYIAASLLSKQKGTSSKTLNRNSSSNTGQTAAEKRPILFSAAASDAKRRLKHHSMSQVVKLWAVVGHAAHPPNALRHGGVSWCPACDGAGKAAARGIVAVVAAFATAGHDAVQGCRLFLCRTSAPAPQLQHSHSNTQGGAVSRLSALLQSVYPPLTLPGVQALLARACREVRGEQGNWEF